MDDGLLDKLRFKSEGTDLDFKQAQYRFVKGSEHEKAELIKDILAIANSWRDGTGYILLGFKDNRPHPAEVVGIKDSIDDASIQQFVHSKVKPKLAFHYEERVYESKAVGVISIPKQQRPFYLGNAYGPLKSNVVYVRRGSSTDEAEPPEVAKMCMADAGHGIPDVYLEILAEDGTSFTTSLKRRFLNFGELPDYESRHSRPYDPLSFGVASMWHDRRDYWRDAAEYLKQHLAKIPIRFRIANRSTFPLSNATLEVFALASSGQAIEVVTGSDLPEVPESSFSTLNPTYPRIDNSPEVFRISAGPNGILGKARLETVLPGESVEPPDSIVLLPCAAGEIQLRIRVLARELAQPIETQMTLTVAGERETIEVEHIYDELAKLVAVQGT